MDFEEIEEIKVPQNMNMHSKKGSSQFDQREGGEYLDSVNYYGDQGAYLSTSNCNIQGDDDSDDCDAFSLHSDRGLMVAARPSEDNTPVKM